ncbi:hypothetical protein [Halorubrum sp. C191]|uniref:hypothetical protein n=1 Tax=Halorubrum sp. C191 TaxID=1383842 RepID=UPI0013043694|nr:hypothetical protein [Halorubrum sp. C191]
MTLTEDGDMSRDEAEQMCGSWMEGKSADDAGNAAEDTDKGDDMDGDDDESPYYDNWIERLDEGEDPCWDGYEMVGLKPNGNPRCVPVDEKESAVAEKVGQTLSKENVRRAKATHDMAEKMLKAQGVSCHKGDSRMYDEDKSDDFSLGDVAKAMTGVPDSASTDAADVFKQMDGDAPEWATGLLDDVEQISKSMDEIEDRVDAVEAEVEKADAGDGEETPEWADGLTEKVESLREDVEALDDRVDRVSKATAGTQQVGGSEESGGEDGDDELSETEKAKRKLFLGA